MHPGKHFGLQTDIEKLNQPNQDQVQQEEHVEVEELVQDESHIKVQQEIQNEVQDLSQDEVHDEVQNQKIRDPFKKSPLVLKPGLQDAAILQGILKYL